MRLHLLLIKYLTYSITQLLTHSLARSLLPSLPPSLTHSLAHAIKHSFIRSINPSTNQSFAHSRVIGWLLGRSGVVPSVSINRARATASKRHTVFRQLYDKLESHTMRTAQHTSMLWHVSFEGEGGIDQGGLFRESLMEMSKELHR
eukprot:1178370-Prorocentrum_minimum.AAC.3